MRDVDKTLILMVSKLIGSANIFILSVFFARMMLKTDYGTYIQVTMLIGLIVLLLGLGIPPSLFYFLPKNNNQRYLIKRTFLVLVLIGVVNVLALWVLKGYISKWLNNPDLSQYVYLAAICVLCRITFNMIQPILLVIKKPIVLAVINTCKGVLLFITMVSCLFFTSSNVTYLIYVLSANFVVEFFIALWVITNYSHHFCNNYDDIIIPLSKQFRFALPLAATGILYLLGREIDKYIVSHYLSPSDLAVYARGAVELPLIHIFAGTIAQVYLPDWVRLFDKGDLKSLIQNWHLTITKTALIMFPLFVLFQIISQDFIVLLYSKEYIGSAIIFSIYLFMIPLQLTQYTAVVESSGKTSLITFGYIAQITFNIIFSVLLLKKFGSVGPAVMTVLSMYLWTGYMLYIIGRIFRVRVFKVFPWIRLGRIMAISIIAGIIAFFIKQVIESVGGRGNEVKLLINMSVVSFSFVSVYVSSLWVTKTLDEQDKKMITRLKFW